MPRRNRECPVCHSTYSVTDAVLRMGRGTTCSRECSYVFRFQKTKTRRICTCSVCGKDFEAHISRIRRAGGRVFCSNACQYIGRKRNVAAMSANGARSYAVRKILRIPDIEQVILDVLTIMEVEVVHQYIVDLGDRSFSVDFLIPGDNLLIEIDSIEHRRKRFQARDADLDSSVTAMGMRLVRVADDGDIVGTVRRVLELLS